MGYFQIPHSLLNGERCIRAALDLPEVHYGLLKLELERAGMEARVGQPDCGQSPRFISHHLTTKYSFHQNHDLFYTYGIIQRGSVCTNST